MLKSLKNALSSLLSIPIIRKSYEIYTRLISEVFGISGAGVHLWYFASPVTFWYEHLATWRGRRDYYRLKRKPLVSSPGLRRNIHRIEKALISRPRRPLFAEKYILETVELYSVAISRIENFEETELKWASDVLTEYFQSVTAPSRAVETAKTRFESLPRLDSDNNSVPKRREKASSMPPFEQMHALAVQRRSVRWFQNRKVPRDLIDKALDVAIQAPSACNRLPYSFLIFDDQKSIARIGSIPFGTAGFLSNIPTLVVVVGHLSQFFSPRDRHTIYIDSSLATMSFLFGLETLGLSSTIINWPELAPLDYKIKKELGLMDSDRVVMMIAVGYADDTASVPNSAKKELNSFRKFLDHG